MSKTGYETTMVLVTRNDLNLSSGKLAAQCSHATAECILKAKRQSPQILDKYLKTGARKIVCNTTNVDELKRIYGQAKDCLLYTSPSPRDGLLSRMPSSA